jgi:hypothetical protein
MEEQFFDDLANGLDEGTLSRRRALKLAGGAPLAAAVPSLFPREAEARRRLSPKRRCKRRGIWLAAADASSPCRCSSTFL